MQPFKDRKEAGAKLFSLLKQFKGQKNTIVLGLPRGGVIVAKEIAQKLHLPLDIIIPRKLGAPQNPELAIGAICNESLFILKDLYALEVSKEYIDQAIVKAKEEASRRQMLYRKQKPPLNLKNMTVIVVDDGIATGATMAAALLYLRSANVKKIILAVPVASSESFEKLKSLADEMVTLLLSKDMLAIGQYYQNFDQVQDEEVIKALNFT